jgi:hypothetical protein
MRKLAYVKVGRLTRIDSAVVEAFIALHTVPAADEAA